jgi:hypothetical protein
VCQQPECVHYDAGEQQRGFGLLSHRHLDALAIRLERERPELHRGDVACGDPVSRLLHVLKVEFPGDPMLQKPMWIENQRVADGAGRRMRARQPAKKGPRAGAPSCLSNATRS